MNVINSGTNTTFGGVKIPAGAWNGGLGGSVDVVFDNSNSTTCVVGWSGTLFVDGTQAVIVPGSSALALWSLGFVLIFGTAAACGMMRRLLGMFKRLDSGDTIE